MAVPKFKPSKSRSRTRRSINMRRNTTNCKNVQIVVILGKAQGLLEVWLL